MHFSNADDVAFGDFHPLAISPISLFKMLDMLDRRDCERGSSKRWRLINSGIAVFGQARGLNLILEICFLVTFTSLKSMISLEDSNGRNRRIRETFVNEKILKFHAHIILGGLFSFRKNADATQQGSVKPVIGISMQQKQRQTIRLFIDASRLSRPHISRNVSQ